MAELRHALHGRCSCGRNRYTIAVPVSSLEAASVFFDNSAATRRTHSAPLTVYLQIPLSWYQSATFAYYPDETHASIRRVYALPPPASSATVTQQQRHFCGYCGTHFARWAEAEGEAIGVAIESLRERDVRRLGEWGLMPADDKVERVDIAAMDDEDEEAEDVAAGVVAAVPRRPDGQRVVSARHVGGRGAPWFEEMVGDSFLGQIRRSGEDGDTAAEWEVIEIGGHGVEETTVRAKRKFGEADEDDDNNNNNERAGTR